MTGALLGDRDALRPFGRDLQDARVDQAVMDDDVGRSKRVHRLDGEEAGVAGAGADEDHASAL